MILDSNAGTIIFVLFGLFTMKPWEHGLLILAMRVFPSICVHVKNWEPLDKFSRDVVLCNENMSASFSFD
jgi:hypothetical protein